MGISKWNGTDNSKWKGTDRFDEWPGDKEYLVTITRGSDLAGIESVAQPIDAGGDLKTAGIQNAIFSVTAFSRDDAQAIALRILAAICRVDDSSFTVDIDELDDITKLTSE